MTDLTPSDRTKLLGILGRLGSDFDGERAAAGLLASRILRERNLSWHDLIPERGQSRERINNGTLWRADLELARKHLSFARSWEQTFVKSIAERRVLSAKQRRVVGEIAAALRARGLS